jgi:hypothetical protein
MGLGDTPRVLYGSENKGVAGKGIRKNMKTKGSGKQWRAGGIRWPHWRPGNDRVNELQTGYGEKRLEVADSKRGFCRGTPTPGVLQKESGFA